MKLKCQCCGFVEEFSDLEAAFDAGWDAPPHFSYVACPLCPGVCVALGEGHSFAHAIWEREGRPANFSLEKCAVDSVIGDKKKLESNRLTLERLEELFAEIRKMTKINEH